MIIDTTGFPKRAVVKRVPAKDPHARRTGIAEYLTLSCGHILGLRHAFRAPAEAGCYLCAKEQEKKNAQG